MELDKIKVGDSLYYENHRSSGRMQVKAIIKSDNGATRVVGFDKAKKTEIKMYPSCLSRRKPA
jgi:hypothetical protein